MCFDKEAGKVTIAFPDLRELTVWWESRYTEDREIGDMVSSESGGAWRGPRGSLGCVEGHSMFGLNHPDTDIGWLVRDRGACYHNPRVCSR